MIEFNFAGAEERFLLLLKICIPLYIVTVGVPIFIILVKGKIMKAWLAKKIPEIFLVSSMTDSEVATITHEGWLHAFLVSFDVTCGWFFRKLNGANEPDLTISARTGLSLRLYQPDVVDAPLPILLLGWFLETVQKGHLNQAIRADYGRAERVRLYLTPRG